MKIVLLPIWKITHSKNKMKEFQFRKTVTLFPFKQFLPNSSVQYNKYFWIPMCLPCARYCIVCIFYITYIAQILYRYTYIHIYIYIIQMTRQLQIYIQSATFHLTLSFLYFITIKIKISYHFDKKTNPVIHLNYYIIFSSNL